jgi:hypothetical protein
MSNVLLLKIGAVFHLVCALMHLAFPKMLNLKENLSELSPKRRIIIEPAFHIMNFCILVFLLVFAIIPFYFPSELLATSIGKTFLASIIAFWAIRIFILQPIFIGLKAKESWQMIIFFLIGFILFLIPGINAI